MKNVFTIPAGVSFAKALATQLLEETGGAPELLPRTRIFLPTRRACGILKEAFLELSPNKPLLLPRMQPLGDIDEEELSIALAADKDLILDIPPAIPPLKRQILLARAIEKLPEFTRGFDQAFALGSALGCLMDQIHTEGLELKNLKQLVPAEFSAHWQITIDFLKILSEEWPKILKENGVIDAADRRNRLIRGLATLWAKHPPPFPVITAGSTGSIPATAELLNVIAGLKEGRVILPGFDQIMDEESWAALDETHPQFGLRHLLEYMNLDRAQVKLWPCRDSEISVARRVLATEMMRSAITTGRWANLAISGKGGKNFSKALENLQVIECGNEREEAGAIAVLLRGALEKKNTTAALVTPSRVLGRRVATACRRWGIVIDDSAGQTLDQTPHGIFFRLCVQAAADRFAPVSLLSLLKHEFTACGMEKGGFVRHVQALEKAALRGLKPAPEIEGILEKLGDAPASERFLRSIEPLLQRFSFGVENEKTFSFSDLVKAHLEMAEGLANPNILWAGESGEAAAALFATLIEQASLIPPVSLKIYIALLDIFMKTVAVRPAWGTHPRLKILGQLEARLTDADLVIMGGLNEGIWPLDVGFDPWMSRPMRAGFGLPASEKAIGQAAHDFVQGFCAQKVVITRAAREEGTPTAPSRWLQRMETVLQAAGLQQPISPLPLAWAIQVDRPESVKPCTRPAAKPPVVKRPQKLSVTRIERWLRDPYGIYAEYILKLKKLEPLEKNPDAAERGKLLHNILQRFTEACPDKILPNAEEILHNIAAEELHKFHGDPALWSFWWQRFVRLSRWLVDYETGWRESARPVLAEMTGQITLGDFTLEARPDRIDETPQGAAIIDYKSGGAFTKKGIETGKTPQLVLEALILKHGGFAGIPASTIASLSYWILTGGGEPGSIVEVNKNIESIIEKTESGLKNLVQVFDNENTPYYSLPNLDFVPDHNDYEHLARVKEWAVLGDDTEVA